MFSKLFMSAYYTTGPLYMLCNNSGSSHFKLLTCNGQSVKLWMWVILFTLLLSGDIIPKADGC